MPSNTNTSLHIAIQNGNMEIIKMLLADGCESLYTRNAEGQTPLDLATAMNNEEIVRLLLEHGAGHVPPQSSPSDFAPLILDTEQRKKRIGFWMTLMCITFSVAVFISILYTSICIGIMLAADSPRAACLQRGTAAGYFLIFQIPVLLLYVLCYYFCLFRLWEEIPRRFARTTPGMAAGLSLVPFFNWYWMFVALGGLYRNMNKVMVVYGQDKRFNTMLIMAACIFWLVCALFAPIMLMAKGESVNIPARIILDLVYLGGYFVWIAFTLVIYWSIRSDVFEFMDIKRSLEATI